MEIKQNRKIYEVNQAYSKDNSVLSGAYTSRIIELLGGLEETKEKTLLELGLGHGNTAKIFDGKFKHHTVIDGDEGVIDYFKKNNKDTKIEIIHSYFEDYFSERGGVRCNRCRICFRTCG